MGKKSHDDWEVKVSDVTYSLRGESPMSGVASMIINVDEKGKYYQISDLHNKAKQGMNELVTVIGKPFRQIRRLSNLVRGLADLNVIIETSGRMVDMSADRSVLIPIVNQSVLVISPDLSTMKDEDYEWMRGFRFNSVYFKFEWVKNERQTKWLIQSFLNLINRPPEDLIKQRRIIVMPSDVCNSKECRDVWAFCLTYRFRYSGREFNRLFERRRNKK